MSPLLQRVLQDLAKLSAEEQLEVIAQATEHLKRRTVAKLHQQLDIEDLHTDASDDPLLGLFSGSPDLATQSEEAWQVDELEPKESILADLKASIRQGKAGETFPISELWDEVNE